MTITAVTGLAPATWWCRLLMAGRPMMIRRYSGRVIGPANRETGRASIHHRNVPADRGPTLRTIGIRAGFGRSRLIGPSHQAGAFPTAAWAGEDSEVGWEAGCVAAEWAVVAGNLESIQHPAAIVRTTARGMEDGCSHPFRVGWSGLRSDATSRIDLA